MIVAAVLASGSFLAAAPAEARYSTGGQGLYPGAIDWFEWGSTTGAPIPTAGLTRTNTRTINGLALQTTCTLSNISSPVNAYASGVWRGDGLDDLYNIGGTGTANQLIAGIRTSNGGVNASFDVSCSVTYDGAPVPLDGLVFADAEAS